MNKNSPRVRPLGAVLRRTWLLVAVLIGCVLYTPFCRNAEAKPTKAAVFVTNYLQRGSFSTKPQPKEVTDTVRVFASPGEYEPATFSIRAAVELMGISVQLAGDLKSSQGSTIRRAAIDIRLIDPFEEWTKKKFESFLLKKDTVDIAANTTRRFWLTIHVPDDAKAGLYRSKIVIGRPITELGPNLGRLETLATLTYEVEVLPLRLLTAHETGMAFFMFHNTRYYSWRFGSKSEVYQEVYKCQRRVFQDMREHGMTTATVYLYPPALRGPTMDPRWWSCDGDGKSILKKGSEGQLGFITTMEMLKETKLVAPGLPVIWRGPTSYGPDVWKAVLDEGRKRKWPEIVFYGIDEPEDEQKNKAVRATMKAFNAFRAKYPQYGLRIMFTPGSSRGIQTVGHYYDIWVACMAQRIGESGVIADAKMHRKELWTYDCMLGPVDAETDRYYFGIWAWVSGVKGCAYWYYSRPLLTRVYPTKDGLIPTIGWEAVREGIDDYRYLATLKRLADKARAAGKKQLARRADKIFADVKEMVTMDNIGKAYHKAKASGVKLATGYQRPRVEPQLNIDSYDRMRLKVARAIVDIAAVLSASKSQ